MPSISTLQRMLCGAFSKASHRTNSCNAALDVLYAMRGYEPIAATLLTWVILPDFWDRMIGSTCLLINMAPSRLTLKTLSQALLSILNRIAVQTTNTDIVVKDVDAAEL